MQKHFTENSLEQLWQEHWQGGVREELFITITDEGLKYGTVILAKRASDGTLILKGKEQRIRSLLAVVNDQPLPVNLLCKIGYAEHALHHENVAMMHMHFALAGFHKLEWMWQLKHLFFADTLLKNGWSIDEMLKCFGISKFNPYHDERGRFTFADNAVVSGVNEAEEFGTSGIQPHSSADAEGVEVAANINDILHPEGKLIGEIGKRSNVQVMTFGYKGESGTKAAEKLYNELTEGKTLTDITPAGYKGRMVMLPDGGIVGIRYESGSGQPTVDVNMGQYLKFKFPEIK